ncbi:MAG: BTAD domain-containing putative transcriptional regulator [Kibdelosporangium sp.]
MRFGVLGPLAVTGPAGELRLRGEHQRALLAMLLFHANRPVTTDVLVGALWPELPPKSYASNLHTYVSRLRARLPDVRIDLAGRGYRMQVATEDVDLLAFREQAGAGRSAARAGQPEKASEHLRRALAQWRGHPLADMHVQVLDAEIGRLESERLAVFEDCVDAELAAGRHAELAGELQAALVEHPMRERLAGQLMLALQHSGRQGEALEVYRTTRAMLIDELGVEPGAALRRLHESMLRGEADVPVQRPTWPICQLPAVAADFAGRQQCLDEVTGLLNPGGHGVPVVVLTGEPGAGKTSLAIGAAHQLRSVFPDGQLFVSLAGEGSPRDTSAVLADLLRGVGVSGPAIPDDLQAKAATYRGMLTDRKVLVVLDDAADPGQVRALLPGTPGCAVLITSRRRLSGLAGVSRVMVGPLTDDEALDLLERIAGRQRIDNERADAARIAKACGNLPLALRIAGTRLTLRPNLRLGVLAGRLEDESRRLDELQVSDLQVRASLTLSYEALSGPSRYALRWLGLMNTQDMPEWPVIMLAGDEITEQAIEELVESGLVEAVRIDETGEPRYRVHDLIRVFAFERACAEDSESDRIARSRSLLNAVLCVADAAASKLPWTMPLPRPSEAKVRQSLPDALLERLTADPNTWFAVERPNLVIGVTQLCAHGWTDDAAQLMDRLALYLWSQGHYADMRLGYQCLAECADHRIATRAKAALALLRHTYGQYEIAVDEYLECVTDLEDLGDNETLGWVRHNLAACLIATGRPEQSIELVTAAKTHFTSDNVFAIGAIMHTQASALHRMGRTAQAARIEAEALDLARTAGEPRQLALALHDRAWGFVLTGDDLRHARDLTEEAIVLLRSVGSRSTLAKALRTLGAIRAGLGERELSVQAFQQAWQLARDLGEMPRQLSCARAIAAARIGQGRAAEAADTLRRCLDAYRLMGSTSAAAITLYILAAAYDAMDGHEQAAQARSEARRLADPRDSNTTTLVKLLLNLASTT